MSEAPRRHVWLPVSRKVGLTAGAIVILIILGCMSLGIGTRPHEEGTSAGTLLQTGETFIETDCDCTAIVYYPVSYLSPPNLEINYSPEQWAEDPCQDRPCNCVVVEQDIDHFRVKNTGTSSRRVTWRLVTWRARGLPAPAISPNDQVMAFLLSFIRIVSPTAPWEGPRVIEAIIAVDQLKAIRHLLPDGFVSLVLCEKPKNWAIGHPGRGAWLQPGPDPTLGYYTAAYYERADCWVEYRGGVLNAMWRGPALPRPGLYTITGHYESTPNSGS